MTNHDKDWVRRARSILTSYFQEGDCEGLCQFWLDFPDFPYTEQEVAHIFAAAQMKNHSEVVINIWDRLGQPLEGMVTGVVLSVAQHLINLDRHDDAVRCWEHVVKCYEEAEFDFERAFGGIHEAFEFFRIGLDLHWDEGKDALDRWERLLEKLQATRHNVDRLHYELLQGLRGDFESMSLYSPDYRENEYAAQTELLMKFVRGCEDLPVHEMDDSPAEVLDAEAVFLREKWLSGDLEVAADRALNIVAKEKIPASEPSCALEYMNVIWEPPVIRNAPAVPSPLAETATEREVLAALFASWDGQTYRNFFEIFRNVKWEEIPPYCAAMAGLACAVAVEEDGLKNPETVRLARLFIKRLHLTKKRAKAYAVYGKLADWFLQTFIDPADIEEVLEARRIGRELLEALHDGELEYAELTAPVEILQSIWSTNFFLHADYEPFQYQEAIDLLFACPHGICAEESNVRYRVALVDRLIRSKEATDQDVREICEEAAEAIDASVLSDEDKDYFYRWFTRRAPSCGPDDFTMELPDQFMMLNRLEVDSMAVQQLARANDMEVLDWLSVRTGVRAGLLRRRADTGERWVVVAHGFATNHPQYSTRYLLRLGETADTFGAFATQKSLVAVIEKLVLPELRSEFTAPDPVPGAVYSLRHFADDGFDKWIPGYDYAGYVCTVPRGFQHPAVLFRAGRDELLDEEAYNKLSEEEQSQVLGRAYLEVIPLLPKELVRFERGIRVEDFFAMHPDKNFAFFGKEEEKPVPQPPVMRPTAKRSTSLRAVRKPTRPS